MKEKIKPQTKYCNFCAQEVTDHHWLCNECWDKKNTHAIRKVNKKINLEEKKATRQLTKEEKHEWLKKQGKII